MRKFEEILTLYMKIRYTRISTTQDYFISLTLFCADCDALRLYLWAGNHFQINKSKFQPMEALGKKFDFAPTSLAVPALRISY